MAQTFFSFQVSPSFPISKTVINHSHSLKNPSLNSRKRLLFNRIRCSASPDGVGNTLIRTCKNCKSQFDPALNHPRACRFHTAHFGGETKRKFESVYTGGTMDTPNSGKVVQYWHCCGSEDPFDPGCTASPHSTYDD
ncbi:Carboxypeptidase [Hirschfeldia incana]|nr:Carboxypeptidase [Hirschfeldia incana]